MTVNATVQLEETVCIICGILFAFPAETHRWRRLDHATFYCPAGHGQVYSGKSDVEKLREQLAAEKSKRDQAEAAAQKSANERAVAEAETIRVGRAFQRAKRRMHGGKCPCCKRNFIALGRHMRNKHPDYAKQS